MSIFNTKRNFSSAEKILIMLICICIGFFCSSMVVSLLYNVFTGTVSYKLLLVISSLLSFGLAAILAALILRNGENPFEHLGFKRPQCKTNITLHFVLVIVFMLAIMPAIELISSWNASYSFPESLKWLEDYFRQAEKSSIESTIQALSGDGIGILLLNLFAIALTPAVCEEMFFRGIMQNQLIDITKKPTVGIFLTAFIFSAIHLQFSGLVPRFILGLALGYLYYVSGSLWTSIAAHFTNNAAVIFVAYFSDISIADTPDLSSFASPIWICTIAGGLVIATLAGLKIFRK